MFLSRYFYEMKKLLIAKQREELKGYNDSDHNESADDDISIESTDIDYMEGISRARSAI